MQARSPSFQKICAYCRRVLPAAWVESDCPSCGAQLGPRSWHAGQDLDASQAQLRAQLETLNDQLVDAGAKNAEDAFSLGCWMSGSIVVVAGILAFLLSGRSLIVTAIVVTGLTLVATVLATFLSLQAKAGAMRRAYGEVIEPQLSALRGVHRMGRQEFLALALQELPEDSPLHRFLAPTDQQEAVLPSGQTGVNG